MTANLISKKDAIDRMRDGLPCESNLAGGHWIKTEWSDFANSLLKFRIPPEPRREAREWWIRPDYSRPYDAAYKSNRLGDIHVREVLPDEVWIERMTEDDWRRHVRDWALNHEHDVAAVVVALRELNLIREDKA